MVQETAYADVKLYAKIGCMERETFTSTKLALNLYTDAMCSQPYDDGETSRRHATKGYEINGYTFSTRVSFRPPFYTCHTCKPEEISETFNKQCGTWYDDDYISSHGNSNNNNKNDNGNGDDNNGDDGNGDDYYQDDANVVDDQYFAANDDVAYDDYYNRRSLIEELMSGASHVRSEAKTRTLTPAEGALEVGFELSSSGHCNVKCLK